MFTRSGRRLRASVVVISWTSYGNGNAFSVMLLVYVTYIASAGHGRSRRLPRFAGMGSRPKPRRPETTCGGARVTAESPRHTAQLVLAPQCRQHQVLSGVQAALGEHRRDRPAGRLHALEQRVRYRVLDHDANARTWCGSALGDGPTPLARFRQAGPPGDLWWMIERASSPSASSSS